MPSCRFLRSLMLSVFSLFILSKGYALEEAPPANLVSEPVFILKSGSKELRFNRAALLQRSDLETFSVENDPSYPHQKLSYRAVPVAALLAELPKKTGDVLQFRCLDGFAASLSLEKVLKTIPGQAVAYLAIEPNESPWPSLPKGGTAGPFYLIWKHAEKSQIGSEEWPFQLSAFEILPSVASRFPAILPDAHLSVSHPIVLGFAVFQKNCFACHTLNGQGEANVGPDLNWPQNPTEYFREKSLRRLIRDPQSLRRWPGSRMPGFSQSNLSDQELNQLLAYLRHMSHRKQAPAKL